MRVLALLLAFAVIPLAGCREHESSSPARPPADAAPHAPAKPELPLTGIWTIVAHHIPGVSAMTDAEAHTRHGQAIRLTDSEALSFGNRCERPVYSSRTVATHAFLSSEFNLVPQTLPPVASLDRVTLLETSCAGAPWTVLGARLIAVDANRALAPWDGVFFELARDADIRALGQEPFWQLEIRKGKELRFTLPLAKRVVVTPDPGARIDGRNGVRRYNAVTEANDLRVLLEGVGCTDDMSGNRFPLTVAVTLNGQEYRGCGGPLER